MIIMGKKGVFLSKERLALLRLQKKMCPETFRNGCTGF